jgi:hypothetical protein
MLQAIGGGNQRLGGVWRWLPAPASANQERATLGSVQGPRYSAIAASLAGHPSAGHAARGQYIAPSRRGSRNRIPKSGQRLGQAMSRT